MKSVQVKTDAFAALYTPYGTNIVRQVVEHHEANGGMSRFEKIQFYHESLLNIAITEKEMKELANQFSQLVVEKVVNAPYVPGALGYIQKCYEQYKLFISTGTPTEEMRQILKGRGIAHYFTDVFGWPEKKNVHINDIQSNYGISSNELIFYGDSRSDLDAAVDAEISFILVRNEFNEKLAESYQGKIINNFVGL